MTLRRLLEMAEGARMRLWGEEAESDPTARLCAVLANCNRTEKGHVFTPKDFYPFKRAESKRRAKADPVITRETTRAMRIVAERLKKRK